MTELSGGERRLVLIARALAQEAGRFVMDEPTASLDFGNTALALRRVPALAEREGLGVLMTTHHPDHAFLVADRAALLHRGALAGPAPPEALVTADALRGAGGRPAPRDLPALAALVVEEVAVRVPRVGWAGGEPQRGLGQAHPDGRAAGRRAAGRLREPVEAAQRGGRGGGAGSGDWRATTRPGFLSLADEHYDFFLPEGRAGRRAVSAFLAALRAQGVRARLAELGFALGDEGA